MASRRRVHWAFWLLGAVAVLLVLAVLFLKPHKKPAPPHAIPVTAVVASTRDIPISITTLGAAQAWISDTIYAQVSGKLTKVNFAEGSYVKAGQVLAEVDPAPYEAELTEAEGTLTRDQALLAGARVDLARYKLLNAQDSIARQTYEDELATVNQDEGTVQLDQGAVAAAKINLSWTRIVSPISGRAGVRLVDPGNLVSANGSTSSTPSTAAATSSAPAPGAGSSASGTGIVIVNQLQPIAVTFTVPQGDFQHLSDLSNGFRKPLAVAALSQESNTLLETGTLNIADNRVDPSTGTVELKARFPNAGSKLWPGQFVNVQLTLQTLHNVTTVPTTAINRGPSGPFVFVVGPGNKAVMRPVAVAWTQGSTAVIKSGVQPGEVVVTDGQMILKPGSEVRLVKPPPGGPAP
ncbi:MAG: efflux RND transporter periplasmic adaptor subunit [Caulobacteraceae bacterium]